MSQSLHHLTEWWYNDLNDLKCFFFWNSSYKSHNKNSADINVLERNILCVGIKIVWLKFHSFDSKYRWSFFRVHSKAFYFKWTIEYVLKYFRKPVIKAQGVELNQGKFDHQVFGTLLWMNFVLTIYWIYLGKQTKV